MLHIDIVPVMTEHGTQKTCAAHHQQCPHAHTYSGKRDYPFDDGQVQLRNTQARSGASSWLALSWRVSSKTRFTASVLNRGSRGRSCWVHTSRLLALHVRVLPFILLRTLVAMRTALEHTRFTRSCLCSLC